MSHPQDKPPVVLVTSAYWSGMEYQGHHLGLRFAARGHAVFFISRTPQRWPGLGLADLRSWLGGTGIGSETLPRQVPEGVTVLTPRWLPPARALRPLNRMLVNHTARKLPCAEGAILLTYVPTFNAIDVIAKLKPAVTGYICVHDYDNDAVVMKDLFPAERELVRTCDVLYADSVFLRARLERMSGGRPVFRSPPGVNYAAFRAAYRGDELDRRRTVCYFGGIGSHVDLDLYAGVAAGAVRVIFIGVVAPELKGKIPAGIEVRRPVPNAKLPDALREMDLLVVAYRDAPYIRAVLPAKFFECLATGKPVLVSGWAEARPYLDCVYDVGGSPERALKTIADLPALHTAERRERQRAVAEQADWGNRFTQLWAPIEQRLQFGQTDPKAHGKRSQ